MSVPMLPKGKSAILVMDCQNDIVHEQGKVGGSLTGGAMPRTIKEKNLLGTIKKLMEAGRAAQVPIIHVRHAYRPDYADMPDNVRIFHGMKQMHALQDGARGAEIHAELKPDPTDFVPPNTGRTAFSSHPSQVPVH